MDCCRHTQSLWHPTAPRVLFPIDWGHPGGQCGSRRGIQCAIDGAIACVIYWGTVVRLHLLLLAPATTVVQVRVFDWNRSKARLNGHTIELQGFSHHPSFAGMGAMTSPRLALFLAQTTKALGMNFWRNSHNP